MNEKHTTKDENEEDDIYDAVRRLRDKNEQLQHTTTEKSEGFYCQAEHKGGSKCWIQCSLCELPKEKSEEERIRGKEVLSSEEQWMIGIMQVKETFFYRGQKEAAKAIYTEIIEPLKKENKHMKELALKWFQQKQRIEELEKELAEIKARPL